MLYQLNFIINYLQKKKQSLLIKKNFFQRTAATISHYTKANEQSRFLSATTYCELAVHLLIFEKTSVLRQLYSYPFAPIQIIAGDIRKTIVFCVAGYLMNAGHFQQKSRIDRRFESRSQDGVVSLKHGRLAHVRSQFSLFRRSRTHKNLPPATFCTSEHAFWLLFARCKK